MSLGAAGAAGEFEAAVALLEAAGVDSLWLPETVYGPAVDPFTGMTFALAKTTRLKVGSGISVLPGRHPVLVAKQLASLAGLAPGRVLPVFGLQPALPGERALFPVPAGQRGAVFDESLALLRLMLTTDVVSFRGSFFTVQDATVGPRPVKPLDIWLAGSAPAGLRRVGRLADGWLASAPATEELAVKLKVVHEAAREAGRDEPPGLNLGTRVNHRDADMLRRELDAAQALGAGYFTIRADQPTDPEDKRHPRSVEWYLDMLHFAGGVIPEYRD